MLLLGTNLCSPIKDVRRKARRKNRGAVLRQRVTAACILLPSSANCSLAYDRAYSLTEIEEPRGSRSFSSRIFPKETEVFWIEQNRGILIHEQ